MFKTYPLTAETYDKWPSNYHGFLNAKSIGKFCALWSLIALKFLAKTNDDRKTSQKHEFLEMNLEGLELSDSFRIEDIPKLDFMNTLNPYVFEFKIKNGQPKLLKLIFLNQSLVVQSAFGPPKWFITV